MRDGIVILAFGTQPAGFFKQATKVCGKDAAIDPDVARMAGANFAIGSADKLAELRNKFAIAAEAAQPDDGLPPGAAKWLASGRRGVSSNTIFQTMTGVNALKDWEPCAPRDPSDLNRCLELLEAVPSFKPRISEMAAISKQWAALAARWDELVACHIDEVGIGWTKSNYAPKTYALMKEILEGAE